MTEQAPPDELTQERVAWVQALKEARDVVRVSKGFAQYQIDVFDLVAVTEYILTGRHAAVEADDSVFTKENIDAAVERGRCCGAGVLMIPESLGMDAASKIVADAQKNATHRATRECCQSRLPVSELERLAAARLEASGGPAADKDDAVSATMRILSRPTGRNNVIAALKKFDSKKVSDLPALKIDDFLVELARQVNPPVTLNAIDPVLVTKARRRIAEDLHANAMGWERFPSATDARLVLDALTELLGPVSADHTFDYSDADFDA